MSYTKPWVVIPTYNERVNAEPLIRALFALPVPGLSVLIVDDSSPDGTAKLVQSLQVEFKSLHLKVRPKKSGLGRAYVDGFGYATQNGADTIVQMDADFSHDPADVPKLLEVLNTHDLAIGSRYSHGISVINWPLSRLMISIFGNVYARIITGIPIKDSTGGFKAWRTSLLKDINFNTVEADGYGFQIVMNYRAWKKGAKLTEVPIIFTERREGQSKMNKAIMREALLLVWRLRLFGK